MRSKGMSVSDASAVWYLAVLGATANAAIPFAPQLRDTILHHTRYSMHWYIHKLKGLILPWKFKVGGGGGPPRGFRPSIGIGHKTLLLDYIRVETVVIVLFTSTIGPPAGHTMYKKFSISSSLCGRQVQLSVSKTRTETVLASLIFNLSSPYCVIRTWSKKLNK